MSVIGIDFGNESCYVGAAKAGGIETLANDYSLRATPSCVAFDGKKRILGVAAKNQQVTNMKNTVSGFKRLLGRNFSDPHVQRELNHIPVKVEKRHDGKVGICVNYLGQQQQFTPEQLTAMLLTKIKETSASALQAQVNDCVITCPVYFTNAERKALLDAAQIAGLNVLRLMNETTATALSYGFYKQDLPDDKPRNVVFVDCGQASLQVSACAFTKGKLRMLASTWEHIGGRDFDNALAEHFNEEFIKRYKINAKTDARALLRLLAEIEKLKKQMSANSTKLPLNIECLMNEVDVTSSMQRAQMEELCAPLFARVEQTFRALLQQSKLSLQDIHSVEIVGGSSRIPMIKHLIEQVFGKPASTTLNQDESVARGAALQCAIMSPAVRVRDFSVTDIQSYEVKLNWEDEGKFNSLTVFPLFHAAPFSRLITFKRKDPFTLTLQYAEPYPCPDPVIGKWHVKNLKTGGEPKEVEVKVRINAHGLVMIMSAAVIERIEAEEAAAAENISAGNGEQHTEGSTDGPEAEKKKKLTKAIELEIDCQMPGFSAGELQNLIQQEAVMVGNDAKETERIDAKNALEEFVYDMRNKLQGGPLSQYVVEKERDEICNNLNDVENWLYEDGEDCERDVYASKLNSFIARTDPIRERAQNFENCPLAFQDLQHAINFAHYAHDEYKRGVEKYNHLTEAEFVNIGEAAEKARRYLENSMPRFSQASRTKDCPIKLSEVEQEKNTLNNVIYTVLNRPKPKVTENNGATDKNNMQTDNNTDDAKAEEQKQAAAADSTMDVD